MRFVLRELIAFEGAAALPGLEEFSDDVVDAVLEEAARFFETVLYPLNRSGDEEGCRFENGVVRTPGGFREAYERYVAGGWSGLRAAPEDGGQGFPDTIGVLVNEMLCSSNIAFSTYPGLTRGAYELLRQFGSEHQRRTLLEPLATGRWTGTMCLTEPQCGTDLGLVRTLAVPTDDCDYRLRGKKIFISAGEHDLSENIVHLVLARTPEAPVGTRGLSLFAVPKYLVRDNGSVGARNGVMCGGIESKMGLHASATCELDFNDSRGELVGSLHKGMRAMFTMMNGARLAVGLQGLALAEAAYQGAVAYAKERRQGRALSAVRDRDAPADPILVHPDVVRMLLTMRAFTEGARAMVGWVAAKLELAERHPDAAVRAESDEFVSLMTPVVKAYLSDLGSEVASLGVQVFGGHGYIRDNGMEQYVRDARIAQIYEGTNGVQAMDLIGRKLPANAGRSLRWFFHPVSAYIEARRATQALDEFVAPLERAFRELQDATAWVASRGLARPEEAAAAASEYLRLLGLVVMAYLWTRAAEIALARIAHDASDASVKFYEAKVDTARFFMQRLLPQAGALHASIVAGAGSVLSFDESSF